MVDDELQNSLPSKWIAISGSAESTPDMNAYAERVVEKAIQQHNRLMFGDNPYGVDWVVLNCIFNHQHKIPETYWTVCLVGNTNDKARSIARFNGEPVVHRWKYEHYHKRDCDMVDFADITICIWDGKSRGTKAVFDYAKSIQRQAWLVTFRDHKAILQDSLKD